MFRKLPVPLMCAFCTCAFAETADENILDMSLSDLMNIPITTASTYRQNRDQVAANAVILTATDIERYGWRSLSDALRSVPGFIITDSRLYHSVGVRGMTPPGSLNNRVLFLINGMRVNENVYDSAMLGGAFPIDIGLIDRIEIIPGSSSAIYGGNVMFGVVNIITKTGRDYGGSEAEITAGAHGTYSLRATGGQSKGDNDWVVSASGLESSGGRYQFNDIAPGFTTPKSSDAESWRRLFAQWSNGGWSAQFVYGSRAKHVPSGKEGTKVGDPNHVQEDIFALGEIKNVKKLGTDYTLNSRLYFANYGYNGTWPWDEGTDYWRQSLNITSPWWGVEERLEITKIKNHHILLGVEYEEDIKQKLGITSIKISGDGSIENTKPRQHIQDGSRLGIYGQDEFQATEKITLTYGGRFDRYSIGKLKETNTVFNPRISAIYNHDKENIFKLVYGTGYRKPTVQDFLNRKDRLSTPKPEQVRNIEGIWQHSHNKNMMSTLSFYHSKMKNQIETDDGGYLVINGQPITTSGLEYALNYQAGQLNSRLSYGYNRTRRDEITPINAPTHMLKINTSFPINNEWHIGIEEQVMSRRQTGFKNNSVAAVALTNITLRYRNQPLNLQIIGSIFNIFNKKYADPADLDSAVYSLYGVERDRLTLDGRMLNIRLVKSF